MIVPVAFEPHHADHLASVTRLLPPVDGERSLDDIALVASYGSLIRARRMKFRRIILAQHGAGQSYAGERRTSKQPGYPGGQDNTDVGLFLVPNEHAAGRWRDAYPKARVAVVGCPKLDQLPRRDPSSPGPAVAISFHWAAHFSPEAGSAFSHFWPQLPRLAERFHLIGHSHPLRRDLPGVYRKYDIEFVSSFDEVCRRADVYVCDNSSTIFEFASTGRPVVLMNGPRYRKQVHHGLRFWDAADVGLQCDVPDELPDVVAEALRDPSARHSEREAALDMVYQPRSGGAQRAADAILDWAELDASVAA